MVFLVMERLLYPVVAIFCVFAKLRDFTPLYAHHNYQSKVNMEEKYTARSRLALMLTYQAMNLRAVRTIAERSSGIEEEYVQSPALRNYEGNERIITC